MKRLIVAFFLLSTWLHAATWYATSSSVNINAASLWVPTSTGSCTGSGTALSFGSQANGDVFDANGCTALAVNVDPGGTSVEVTLQSNATNGGGFTYATATNITIHANITSTKSIALTVTGSTGAGTISGNLTGGSTAAMAAVTDAHTSVTMTIVGNITGGTATTAYGYTLTSTGPVSITGNVSASATAVGLQSTANGVVTITGNCSGSPSSSFAGCVSTTTAGTGGIVLTGSIINGLHALGVGGTVFFTPGATNYILFAANGSYTQGTVNSNATEMPTNPGVSNVLSGVQYGSYTGTASGGSSQATGCSTGWK